MNQGSLDHTTPKPLNPESNNLNPEYPTFLKVWAQPCLKDHGTELQLHNYIVYGDERAMNTSFGVTLAILRYTTYFVLLTKVPEAFKQQITGYWNSKPQGSSAQL